MRRVSIILGGLVLLASGWPATAEEPAATDEAAEQRMRG